MPRSPATITIDGVEYDLVPRRGPPPAATADDLGNVTVDESGHAVLQRSARPPLTDPPLTAAQMRELLYPPEPAAAAPPEADADPLGPLDAYYAELDVAVWVRTGKLAPEDEPLLDRLVALHRRRILGEIAVRYDCSVHTLTSVLGELADWAGRTPDHIGAREFYAVAALMAERGAAKLCRRTTT